MRRRSDRPSPARTPHSWSIRLGRPGLAACLLAALSVLAACGMTGAQEDRAAARRAASLPVRTARPAATARTRGLQPVEPAGPWVYDLEQLRTGDFDRILHGAGPLWTPNEFDGYRTVFAETPPLIVRLGINIRDSQRLDLSDRLEKLRSELDQYADLIPLLTLTFNENFRDGTAVGHEKEVLAGDYDPLVTAIAEIVRDLDKPVFVRIGPECNGYWNGYDPELFPEAFRHIVDIFRGVGADNIITVWNTKPTRTNVPPFMDFYPGGDYVDWWSLDVFGDDFRVKSLRKGIDDFLLIARLHEKPVMIPETCPSGLDIDKAQTWHKWFLPFFDLVKSDPNIKAFCYSNRDFASNDRSLAHWKDMRVDRSGLRLAYQIELKDPLFVHHPAGPEGVPPFVPAEPDKRNLPVPGSDDGPRRGPGPNVGSRAIGSQQRRVADPD